MLIQLCMGLSEPQDFTIEEETSQTNLSLHERISDEFHDDISLIGTSDGKLYAINGEGNLKWETSIGSLKSFKVDLKVSRNSNILIVENSSNFTNIPCC